MQNKSMLAAAALLWLSTPALALGQAGVLTEEGRGRPNPSVLALVDMEVNILIDHLHATVQVTQQFENRTRRNLRGRYELALGQGAAVSGFALWEGEHRREAVVVERQRGRRIFEELTRRNIDPGLMETSDQGPRQNVYAIRVDPIQPHSIVRVEVTYSQDIALAGDEGLFVFPLAGRANMEQNIGHLRVEVRGEGAWALESVELFPSGLALSAPLSDQSTSFAARWDGHNVSATDDLSVAFRLGRDPSAPLRPQLLAYRRPLKGGRVDRSAFGGGRIYLDDRGYFVLRTPAQFANASVSGPGPQDVVFALDTSLSMSAGKLERAVGAIEELLTKLRPGTDRFGLITFNDDVHAFPGGLEATTADRVAQAKAFFRSSYLSGGTDLRHALPAALGQLAGSKADRRTVVLITDGQPSLGLLDSTPLAESVAQANTKLGASRGRVFILGVGDDANHLLLSRVARESGGLYAHVGEGAPLAPVLRSFVHQLSVDSMNDLRATFDTEGIEDVYPAEASQVFDGSAHVLFGRYRTPTKAATVRVQGRVGSKVLSSVLRTPLPIQELSRPWIGRGWAQLRIAHLLARIDAEGERPEWVQEIIALAREYTLVTPYTSLIAAARSLLRPRQIMPGDPVLRVRTDPSDRAVTAIFPFGLVKELRPIAPGLFETRFLAPVGLSEGRHDVDLIIEGGGGELRAARDYFVIDSNPPQPRIVPLEGPFRSGEIIALKVYSDEDTRHLFAHLGGRRAELLWSSAEQACVGRLRVPSKLATGAHQLLVVAEDHAHNVGTTATEIEVLGR